MGREYFFLREDADALVPFRVEERLGSQACRRPRVLRLDPLPVGLALNRQGESLDDGCAPSLLIFAIS